MERVEEGEREALLNTNTNRNGSDSAVTSLLLFSISIAVCGSFVYGAQVGYTSPVESQLMDQLALSTAEFSLFGSMLSIGVISGSLFTGKLTDLLGRRGAMGFADILYITGGTVISISQKAWSLDMGRFFVGCGTGIIIYTVPIYIGEITPKNLRGGFVAIIQLMSTCGTLAMFILGSFVSWRVLILIGVFPALIQLLGLFFIPESPRYLAKIGKNKAHEVVLQRLRGKDIDISTETTEIQEFTQFLKQRKDVNLFGLFQRKYAHSLAVVLGLMALGRLGGTTGITYYASSIFESAEPTHVKLCGMYVGWITVASFVQVTAIQIGFYAYVAGFSGSIGSIGTSVIQLPSIAMSIYLVDKFGRRPLLMIFPMNAKGAAGSLASVTCGVCAWIASYAFTFSVQWSYSGTFFIYAGINAFTLLFIAKMVPETKGKTLEQIQSQCSLH